jgi:hypothetical protein
MSLVISIMALPMVFCAGVCCLPFPLISLIFGGFGYIQTKNDRGETDAIALAGIIISTFSLLYVICSTIGGFAFMAVGSII